MGVDFSTGMLAQARRAHPDATWVRADVRALPFAGAFDLAVSFGADGHFLPAERPALFAGVHRTLRPGGVFAFPIVAPQPISARRYWALLGFDLAMRVRNAVWRPPFVMYYRTCPLHAVRNDLAAAGFTVTTLALTALGRARTAAGGAGVLHAEPARPDCCGRQPRIVQIIQILLLNKPWYQRPGPGQLTVPAAGLRTVSPWPRATRSTGRSGSESDSGLASSATIRWCRCSLAERGRARRPDGGGLREEASLCPLHPGRLPGSRRVGQGCAPYSRVPQVDGAPIALRHFRPGRTQAAWPRRTRAAVLTSPRLTPCSSATTWGSSPALSMFATSQTRVRLPSKRGCPNAR